MCMSFAWARYELKQYLLNLHRVASVSKQFWRVVLVKNEQLSSLPSNAHFAIASTRVHGVWRYLQMMDVGGAGYQSLYEVARSRGVNVKFWEPRYTGTQQQHAACIYYASFQFVQIDWRQNGIDSFVDLVLLVLVLRNGINSTR